jgi:hypothetical protein
MNFLRSIPRAQLALCVACAVTACSYGNVTITSKKAEDYRRQPTRLFVVEAMGAAFERFSPAFQTALADAVKGCGVTGEFSVLPPEVPTLSFSDQGQASALRDAAARQSEFGPDGILQITFASGKQIGGSAIVLEYLLNLRDPETKKTVWKGLAEFYVAAGVVETDRPAKALANNIVAQMAKDGIFRSCASITG